MSIGTNIKRLRREKDMTQEQLADYLGITSRAVSQWECDRTAPDIVQLPLLSRVLGVSTDTLLGVDLSRDEECISTIITRASTHDAQGEFVQAAAILRQGLCQYPRSYRLMARLADSLGNLAGNDDEVITLCQNERIILSGIWPYRR